MTAGRLRRQAEMCDKLALFMSDPVDRASFLKAKRTFLAIAAEADARPAVASAQARLSLVPDAKSKPKPKR